MHDDVIKWKYFPRYWPFVRGIHRSPVNSPHKGQGRGALMYSLIYVWINGWVNNREAGDLRRQRAHHDVIVMCVIILFLTSFFSLSSQKATRCFTQKLYMIDLPRCPVLGANETYDKETRPVDAYPFLSMYGCLKYMIRETRDRILRCLTYHTN